jgi:YHYH protein
MMHRLLLFLMLATTGLASAHDLTALPLGDGKLSKAPKIGWIWPCYIDSQAGGADRDGPWINKAKGTYDLNSKAIVPGSEMWLYVFQTRVENNVRIFSTNDFPSHPTGTYPIPSDSVAFQYDKNPNKISKQSMLLQLPAKPVLAPQAGCAPGALGVLLSGSVLFNALDAPGRDAVAHETQDACQGHPQVSGVYHYHSVSACVDKKREADGHSSLVGYMVDGFGLFGHYSKGGKLLTSQDLDECHGHTHVIPWDDKQVNMYHYHATWDFPYSAGCLRGRYKMSDVMTLSGPPPNQRTANQSERPAKMRQQNDTAAGPQNARPFGNEPSSEARPPPEGTSPRSMPPLGLPIGRHPDLNIAAEKLGINVEQLRRALGPPPPDLQAAAQKLGISVEALRAALDSAR